MSTGPGTAPNHPPLREWLPVALGYLIFFGSLLLGTVLRGELPGNCDTWLNGLALPNAMLSRLGGLLSGADVGTSLYPETDIFEFGESAFGTSAIFILFKLILQDDIVAYYPFMVTLLVLDAMGVYLLARCYVKDSWAAAFAGLAFSASNYHLGNIDSPHSSFFFVAFLCLYYVKRYLASGERRALVIAAILGGAQAYFSAYVFLFQTAVGSAMLVGAHLSGERRLGHDWKGLVIAVPLFLSIATPFFGFYARAGVGENFSNPWTPIFLAELHSLSPSDLVRTLENNVLYPFAEPIVAEDMAHRTEKMVETGLVTIEQLMREDAQIIMGRRSSADDVKYFVYTRRCAFLGVALYALAALGVWSARRWELLFLYIAALFVSFGPWISIGEHLLPNVLYPAYKWIDAAGALRVPARAFSFSLLAVVLAAAIGLERLGRSPRLEPPGRRKAIFALLAAVVVIENVPMPLKSFAGERYATPAPLVSDFFAGEEGYVLLNLPSKPGGALFRDSQNLFEWNRELIYMNQQTYHHQNIVNGIHGYLPKSRLEIQKLINALPERRAFAGLHKAGIDYVVYHRDLELPWERGQYELLANSGMLAIIDESPEVTIFGWSLRPPERPRGAGRSPGPRVE